MKNDLSLWESLFEGLPSPIDFIGKHQGVNIFVKREDLNHSLIQGNKLRKLKYSISEAISKDVEAIFTFGGAYSNHLAAVAAVANYFGFYSMGFVRGDELHNKPEKWSNTLTKAKKLGMDFVFLSRQDYQLKSASLVVQDALNQMPNHLILSEGGSDYTAVKGVKEMVQELSRQLTKVDCIICACGTGGTLAGIIDGTYESNLKSEVIGVPVINAENSIVSKIKELSQFNQNVDWRLESSYKAGGYSKLNTELMEFGRWFKNKYNLSLDRVYNIKSFFAAFDMIEKGKIDSGKNLVIIHTGGLQGGIIS